MTVEWKLPIGARVCDVVAHSGTDRVYVAVDDSVIVLAGSDIAARIPVGPDTKRLILSADEALLYVVGYDGSVRIIDTAEHTVTNISGRPSMAEVVSPDGRRLYTAHPTALRESTDSWITVTAADRTSRATVAIENYATGMDLSLDGALLYIAVSRLNAYTQYSPGSVTLMDTARNAVVDSIEVPLSPDTVTVSPDGSRVVVTHYDTNSVSAIDVEQRSVSSVRLPDAPLRAVVTPDGSGVYVIGTRSLLAVDFFAGVSEVVPAGRMPRRMHFSPDGKRAYVADYASCCVTEIDTITNSVIAAVPLDGHPEALALSGDGRWLYAADYWGGTLSAISIASIPRDAEAA